MARPAGPIVITGAPDYVVVGAGAGGGPLAARLAEAGMSVLLLEAGLDGTPGTSPTSDYAVPAFHARQSEAPGASWRYFVRHYTDEARQALDPKYDAEQGGVFYPRAAGIGGCTSHHAMIVVYPHDADWDGIAERTGDPSWGAERMRGYFERIEACSYARRPLRRPRLLGGLLDRLPVVRDLFRNGSRHGFDGWLPTTLADPRLAVGDRGARRVLLRAAARSLRDLLGRPLRLVEGLWIALDPNDVRVRDVPDGLWQVPISVRDGRRYGTRERVLSVAREHPDRLEIRTGCLVTRVVLAGSGADLRAVGVEYVEAPHAYRADPDHDDCPLPPPITVRVRREVLLAGGTFNTPQLLMLSGIGPAAELARVDVPVRRELPGVGRNLQDRYEVGVVNRLTEHSTLIQGNRFRPPAAGEQPDPAWRAWLEGRGVYGTNGALAAFVRRSRAGSGPADLFLFGLPADFRGYYAGYSEDLVRHDDRFTWAVLKAHTANRAGTVGLRSADPRDTPTICFRYFDEGDDPDGADLDAVVTGVRTARDLMGRAGDLVDVELDPGPQVRTDDELRAWVRDRAWGHHASGTCAIGPADDPVAVVDSRLRVHGVAGLRVVDASVFPRIPGFFIVTAIHMVAEKAGDVVLEDAGAQ